MDATPTLIWSTQHLVSEGLGAPAVPRDRQSITANAFFHADAAPQDDIPIPTLRGPHGWCADGP
jgi:hypothetical protein